jgi:hypothetical protein
MNQRIVRASVVLGVTALILRATVGWAATT